MIRRCMPMRMSAANSMWGRIFWWRRLRIRTTASTLRRRRPDPYICRPAATGTSSWTTLVRSWEPLAGGQAISVTAGLDTVPIYVRAGAILPFCELEQWVGQLPANPLTLNFYPGPDRWTDAQAYQLYQDDGITQIAQNSGAYRISRIYQQTLNNGGSVTRQIRVARVTDAYTPPAQFFYIAILGSITSAHQVTRDGAVVPNVPGPASLQNATADAWYWNES